MASTATIIKEENVETSNASVPQITNPSVKVSRRYPDDFTNCSEAQIKKLALNAFQRLSKRRSSDMYLKLQTKKPKKESSAADRIDNSTEKLETTAETRASTEEDQEEPKVPEKPSLKRCKTMPIKIIKPPVPRKRILPSKLSDVATGSGNIAFA